MRLVLSSNTMSVKMVVRVRKESKKDKEGTNLSDTLLRVYQHLQNVKRSKSPKLSCQVMLVARSRLSVQFFDL